MMFGRGFNPYITTSKHKPYTHRFHTDKPGNDGEFKISKLERQKRTAKRKAAKRQRLILRGRTASQLQRQRKNQNRKLPAAVRRARHQKKQQRRIAKASRKAA